MTSSSHTISPRDSSWRHDAGVMGLIGLGHMASHFSHLMLPPLFPWLREAFGASYTQLGLLVTVFFVASSLSQAACGFAVDRFGPRRVLFAGLSLLALAAFVMASAPRWEVLMLGSLIAGLGNGVFHPVDYTLINRKIDPGRLGHAYSIHGVTGSLGWAVAPVVLVPLAMAFSWRVALVAAGALVLAVLALLAFHRERLGLPKAPRPAESAQAQAGHVDSSFLLRLPALWLCFGYFVISSLVLGAMQTFAPEAARHIHDVPVGLAALCLSVYMVSNAAGLLAGGFLAADPSRNEQVVMIALACAAAVALGVSALPLAAAAVPVMFGLMGFLVGCASPSRDVLIKRATPSHASGRVYGIVYSGADIGQAISPLIFGMLMDRQAYPAVLWLMAGLQCALIFMVTRVSRAPRSH